MGIWHYTNEKGERVEEHLTPEQADLDGRLVGEFQTLESTAASGGKVGTAEAAQFFAHASKLPANRIKHWHAELKRIGVTLPATKPAATAVKTESTTTVEAKK